MGREGGTKNAQKGDVHYLVDLRRQGEGGYSKNLEFGKTSFMDGTLAKLIIFLNII